MYLRKFYKPDLALRRWVCGDFQFILQVTELRPSLSMASLGSVVGARRQSDVRCGPVPSLRLHPVADCFLFFFPFFMGVLFSFRGCWALIHTAQSIEPTLFYSPNDPFLEVDFLLP